MKSELPFFRTDLALKNAVRAPADSKPRFNWRESLPGGLGDQGERVADLVGQALTDLLVSREEKDIFNEDNRRFVAAIACEVAGKLVSLGDQAGEAQIRRIVEEALVRAGRHEVAKAVLFSHDRAGEGEEPPAVTTRLVRRNGQFVPWIPSKIEVAVRKAFLSLDLDSAPAAVVAAAVTRRVAESGLTAIGIEEVQDLVQEELMRQRHFKVAESYILFRAYRARLREEAAVAPAPVDDHQDALILIKQPDGSTYLWNGEDLRRRIAFAGTGLELTKGPKEIEADLRRGISNEITEADLRKTIELNAKSLVEVDADFAKFAARICLSYIYEEVLGWDIVRDGVAQLKEFHRAKFAAYVERGIAIGRLSPDLRKYDLAKLAAALDPAADLDF